MFCTLNITITVKSNAEFFTLFVAVFFSTLFLSVLLRDVHVTVT